MKKYSSTIFSVLLALAVVVMLLIPHVSMAIGEEVITKVGIDVFNSGVATIGNIFLKVTSSFVAITGTFLNVAINLTTHIQGIYETVTGIKAVWITVRDLSSIFIIFALLFFSIKTILGFGGSGLNQLIAKIFMAGVLINFSLFFVKVAVDTSNLVSLQFYNAIAPETSQNWTVYEAFKGGGISNVFMQSLKIPKIYGDSKGVLGSGDVLGGITIATFGGIAIMIFAGLSFLAAAVAFTVRTAILLFIMALSPTFFIGLIFPEIKKKVSDPLLGLLKGQCVFMPVYLFLLYISLKIIGDPSFMEIFNKHATGTPDPNGFGPVWIGVMIQYSIALIFINAPLVAAIELGGMGMKWAPGSSGALGALKMAGGVVGKNFLGRAGRDLGKRFDNMAASAQGNRLGRGASTVLRGLNISQTVRGGLASAEKGKYGGSSSFVDSEKENKERRGEISRIMRGNEQSANINAAIGNNIPLTSILVEDVKKIDNLRKTVGGMDVKELEDTKFETLKDPMFATAIPASKFDAIMKGDNLTSTQKQELKSAREKGFEKIVQARGADYLLSTVLKGKPQDIAKLPTSILKRSDIAIKLDPATLRKIVDENVGQADRDAIRKEFATHLNSQGSTITPGFTRAYDYLNSPAGQIF